jgi:hypothetical protein
MHRSFRWLCSHNDLFLFSLFGTDWSGADAVALEDSSADAVALGLLTRMVDLGLLSRMVALELLSQMVSLGLLGADTVVVVGLAWVFIALAREDILFLKKRRLERKKGNHRGLNKHPVPRPTQCVRGA